MVNREVPDLLAQRYPAVFLPAARLQPGREKRHRSNYHDLVSVPPREVTHALENENSVRRLNLVGKKAGVGENSHGPLSGSPGGVLDERNRVSRITDNLDTSATPLSKGKHTDLLCLRRG